MEAWQKELVARIRSPRELALALGHPGWEEALFAALRSARPGILIRLCTRAPVTLPSRVTSDLVALLREYRPLVV